MVNNQSLYYNHVFCNPLNAFTKIADVGVEIQLEKSCSWSFSCDVRFIGTKCDSYERKLIDELLKDYNTDVRPVENTSQVLEVTVALQPYRLLRMVSHFLY